MRLIVGPIFLKPEVVNWNPVWVKTRKISKMIKPVKHVKNIQMLTYRGKSEITINDWLEVWAPLLGKYTNLNIGRTIRMSSRFWVCMRSYDTLRSCLPTFPWYLFRPYSVCSTCFATLDSMPSWISFHQQFVTPT